MQLYCFSKEEKYTYRNTVEDVAKVSSIEEIAEEKLRIKYNLITDAKAYGLYKIASGTISVVSSGKDCSVVKNNRPHHK